SATTVPHSRRPGKRTRPLRSRRRARTGPASCRSPGDPSLLDEGAHAAEIHVPARAFLLVEGRQDQARIFVLTVEAYSDRASKDVGQRVAHRAKYGIVRRRTGLEQGPQLLRERLLD